MPRALLSVSDKTGIVDLGRGLASRGYELVSTGGTARTLVDAGLTVTGVSDLTGFPEMMDGRVKTLHPSLHGGILARRDRPDDLAALAEHGIGLVDVVVVNLYPFAKAAANPATPFEALVEEIDIGGPSLVRAAAKNFRDVLVVVDPVDYARLLQAIDATPGLALRFELMVKAFAHTAEYDTTIASTLLRTRVNGDRVERAFASGYSRRADTRTAGGSRSVDGEDQGPALRREPAPESGLVRDLVDAASGFGRASILQGRELSYTNLLDLDAAARIVLEFDEPAAVVIKHTNPCGAAIGDAAVDALPARARGRPGRGFRRHRRAEPPDRCRAPLKRSCPRSSKRSIAPAVDPAARDILARKANMRVVVASFDGSLGGGRHAVDSWRDAVAGARRRRSRPVNRGRESTLPEGLRVVTRRQPSRKNGLRCASRGASART